MKSKDLNIKAHNLVNKSKEKGLIKKYKEFCKTDFSQKTKLTNEEIIYYTSKNKEEK